MVEQLAVSFAEWLAENGGEPQKKKIYAYGIECAVNELFSDILLLCFGFLFHRLGYTLIWCISFTLVRIHLGGFHASTHGRCIALGTLAGVTGYYLNPLWSLAHPWSFLTVTAFAVLFALLYAPVVHKNHPLHALQRKQARRRAVFFILLEGGGGFLLYPQAPLAAMAILTGLFIAFLMALIGRVAN